MFGKNKILKQDLSSPNTLRVVKGSPFYTIQGEGPYAGHPATFIRLHGCNLRCTFCDTVFDEPDDPMQTVGELVEAVAQFPAKLVVITGGEPLRQDIRPLALELFKQGHIVQIETAGTLWLPGIEAFAQVVVSPKTSTLNAEAFRHARAFKYVISNSSTHTNEGVPITATQPGAGPKPLAGPRPGAPVYLSPMDEYDERLNSLNRQLVAKLAMRHGYIAGLQMHKFLEVD